MIDLFVLSRHQHILDRFFTSLELSGAKDKVKVYAITEGLRLPDYAIDIRRDSFRPTYYFNQIVKNYELSPYVGIVNDDIEFARGWVDSLIDVLKNNRCVSPGFIETHDKQLFEVVIEKTASNQGLVEGMFDSFYCFDSALIEEVGGFDESVVEWYDIDWYLTISNAGIKPVTMKKVLVMHYKRETFSLEEPDKKKIRSEIIQRYGKDGLNKAKAFAIDIRKEFRWTE